MSNLMSKHPVSDLLIKNIARDTVMGIEDALKVGAMRAYLATKDIHIGHRAHALGQLRHTYMNEACHESWLVSGAMPSPIRGNSIVVANSGVFRMGRFNISGNIWNNARRSKSRLALAEPNVSLEPLVQSDLFQGTVPVFTATVFFIANFSGSLAHSPDAPLSIEIAVPDHTMTDWLFREGVTAFLKRYDAIEDQLDNVQPKLKRGIIKRNQGDDE